MGKGRNVKRKEMMGLSMEGRRYAMMLRGMVGMRKEMIGRIEW
jgi:hypothetical protein